MGDPVRELLRSAQEAEVRGDRPGAAELLARAAALTLAAGKQERAQSLLRHALRLDPSRRDLQAQVERCGPPQQEAPAGLVERGPTFADPSREAWCSFCCRPGKEVGQLVAGPAGAFVCRGCTGEARQLFGGPLSEGVSGSARRTGKLSVDRNDAGPADRRSALPGAPGGELVTLRHQTQALDQLIRAVEQGRRRILLLGPAGSGKSALLRAIARKKAGTLVLADGRDPWPEEGLLLVDGADGLGEERWAELTSALDVHPSAVLLALRGRAPEATYFIQAGDVREHLPSSQSLVTATGGKLPLGVAEATDFAAALEAAGTDPLAELAAHLLRESIPAEVRDALATSLAELAAASGRGAHELVALVRRVPPGAWRLDQPGGYRGRRKPRRKAGPP
jgi:hypothetical protein